MGATDEEAQQRGVNRPLLECSTEETVVLSAQSPVAECVGHSGVMHTTYNVVNIFMGVGLLSMAYTLHLAGWAGLLCLYGALALFLLSAHLLVACFDLLPEGVPHTYPQLGETALGSTAGRYVVTLFAFTEFFGGSCMQQIVMWQQLTQLLPDEGINGVAPFRCAQIIACVAWLPLMFVRDFRALSYTSAVGFLSTVGVTLAVVIAVLMDPLRVEYAVQPPPTHEIIARGIVQASGIYAVSVSGHSGLPSLRNSMKQPNKFGTVLALAFGSMAVIYSAVAATGYYYFGTDATALITSDLSAYSKLGALRIGGYSVVQILGLLIDVNVFTTLPVIIMAQQDILLSSVAPAGGKEGPYGRRFARNVGTGIRLLIFAVTAVLSGLAADMLGVVESLVGGFCSLNCSLFMPALFYLLLRKQKGNMGRGTHIAMAVLVAFSVAAMVLIVGMNAEQLMHPAPAAGENGLSGPKPWQFYGVN